MQAEYLPKIRNAICKAISLLEQTSDARPESLDDVLWHASEETEYAAAVLSLTHGFTDVDPEFRDTSLFKTEIEKVVSFAKSLLHDSLELIEKDPSTSYEKLRYAVQILRKVQTEKSP